MKRIERRLCQQQVEFTVSIFCVDLYIIGVYATQKGQIRESFLLTPFGNVVFALSFFCYIKSLNFEIKL